jgi:hypothetical protein
MWRTKLAACVFYDLLDMTVGRALIPIPFSGEIGGCILCYAMFGRNGLLYGLEALDITEAIDGFIPTATIIALSNRPEASTDPGIARRNT